MTNEENNPYANEEAKDVAPAPTAYAPRTESTVGTGTPAPAKTEEIKSEAVIKAADNVTGGGVSGLAEQVKEHKKVEEKPEPKPEAKAKPEAKPIPIVKPGKGVTLKIAMAHDGLKKCMNVIGSIITQGTLKVTKEKMSFISMDEANVCMVMFEMKASSCAQWEVPDEGVELPIILADFNKVLKRVGGRDVIILEMVKNLFTVTIQRGNASPVYNIPLIELEDKGQKIPPLTFTESVTMAAKEIIHSFEDFYVVAADGVTFNIKDGVYNIFSSADLKGVNIEIKQDDKVIIPTGGEGAKSRFSVEYLSKIFKPMGKKIKIELGNDYPLMVSFLETDDQYGLKYILAPRVDNS